MMLKLAVILLVTLGGANAETDDASVPEKPSAILKEVTPTSFLFIVSPPENREYVYYSAEFGPKDGAGDTEESQDSGTIHFYNTQEIYIKPLNPSTTYNIYIKAKNDIGESEPNHFEATTEDIREPYPVNIVRQQHGENYPDSYTISWKEPADVGMPIYEYTIKYRMVKVKNGGLTVEEPLSDWIIEKKRNWLSLYYHELTHLKRDTYYQVEVTASNEIGESRPNQEFVFKTGNAICGKFFELHAGHCYSMLIGDFRDWQRAQGNCYDTNVNAYTIVMETEEEFEYVTTRLQEGWEFHGITEKAIWTGGKRESGGGNRWLWNYGYSNIEDQQFSTEINNLWYPDEPNNSAGNEDRVDLFYKDGEWGLRDRPDYIRDGIPTICEYDPGLE